jgi:hypothetical protein
MDARVKPAHDEERCVSRTRCGILHAAPQSHSASKTRVNALMAKSYALRCVRGTRPQQFSENRLRSAKPIFLVFDNYFAPLTFINHIETIP